MSGKTVKKTKTKQCKDEHGLPLHADLEAKFNVADDRVIHLEQLLVAWVTSKRADARWMRPEEKALFDEGMKLVPPRKYVRIS